MHSVVPGTHTPPQLPGTVFTVPTQALVHVVAVPHWPFVLHVATCVSLVHSVVPGLHVPVHTPPTHAWFVQATAFPHWPFEPHVCTADVPEHCVAPDEHEPVH
jgi:hypothetical protein